MRRSRRRRTMDTDHATRREAPQGACNRDHPQRPSRPHVDQAIALSGRRSQGSYCYLQGTTWAAWLAAAFGPSPTSDQWPARPTRRLWLARSGGACMEFFNVATKRELDQVVAEYEAADQDLKHFMQTDPAGKIDVDPNDATKAQLAALHRSYEQVT